MMKERRAGPQREEASDVGGDRTQVEEEEGAGQEQGKGGSGRSGKAAPGFVTSVPVPPTEGGSERAGDRGFLRCWSLPMKLSGLNPSWQLVLFLHFAVKQMTL